MRRAEQEKEKELVARHEQKLRDEDRQKRRAAAHRRHVGNMTNRDSMRFAEHDLDGDQKLDFEEYLAMMPSRVRETHPRSQLRAWFDTADVNGDGVLSLTEFFSWSLANAVTTNGENSLLAAFAFYDRDKKGSLDAREFEQLAKAMGFGLVANEIFNGFDVDGSGAISYQELISSLQHKIPGDTGCQRMLLSLVHSWNLEVSQQASSALDTSGWSFRGNDVDTVRSELQALLLKSGGNVVDLIKIFDQDADTELQIDDVEFATAMRNIGYRGPPHVLSQLFASLDIDNDHKVGFNELFEFVRGRQHCLDERQKTVRAMQLEPPHGADYTLDQIQWNVPTLRYLLQQMLEQCGLSVTHLMRAWDVSRDGLLSERELISNMKSFFKNQGRLWEEEVREVVAQAFREMDSKKDAGTQGTIDIEEMAQWLRIFTEPAVMKKKTRRQLSCHAMTVEATQRTSARGAKPNVVEDSIAAAVERTTHARLMVQQRMQHRETAVNGLPPLQRWEVPKTLELPPLSTGRVGFDLPNIELSPRFAPPRPRVTPQRPTTHQLPTPHSPRRQKVTRRPSHARSSKTTTWRPVVPRVADPLV